MRASRVSDRSSASQVVDTLGVKSSDVRRGGEEGEAERARQRRKACARAGRAQKTRAAGGEKVFCLPSGLQCMNTTLLRTDSISCYTPLCFAFSARTPNFLRDDRRRGDGKKKTLHPALIAAAAVPHVRGCHETAETDAGRPRRNRSMRPRSPRRLSPDLPSLGGACDEQTTPKWRRQPRQPERRGRRMRSLAFRRCRRRRR